eukprot:gnl/TRDRNA2_/TRDRNA2_193832_c0_seq1.p2 gnl/TRDRNA2_/TRDRNA2_193832_c0~~gnl/TRDRNA2_/TRDRNA2_193832_c0_seq1.p2  ORF type:complete len:116 (-),score=9.95 gnl/TRDRNA2_/TRDRNA2_193832_c0_seq1:65-412(-)
MPSRLGGSHPPPRRSTITCAVWCNDAYPYMLSSSTTIWTPFGGTASRDEARFANLAEDFCGTIVERLLHMALELMLVPPPLARRHGRVGFILVGLTRPTARVVAHIYLCRERQLG